MVETPCGVLIESVVIQLFETPCSLVGVWAGVVGSGSRRHRSLQKSTGPMLRQSRCILSLIHCVEGLEIPKTCWWCVALPFRFNTISSFSTLMWFFKNEKHQFSEHFGTLCLVVFVGPFLCSAVAGGVVCGCLSPSSSSLSRVLSLADALTTPLLPVLPGLAESSVYFGLSASRLVLLLLAGWMD